MQHFFVTPGQVQKDRIMINGGDVNHIKNVLRMKTGEELEVCDGSSRRWLCRIESIEADTVIAEIVEEKVGSRELPSRLYLFQGLPKSDKMELIIQKAVELGVYEVIPVETKRCVVKLDAKKAPKKIERWNVIAESAAKQSGRNLIPKVKNCLSFREAVKYAQELDVCLIPYELAEGMNGTRNIISNIRGGQSVGIFIGPEGGFETEEVAYAGDNGVKAVTLGRRILRTETAGLTMLSVLMYHLEIS